MEELKKLFKNPKYAILSRQKLKQKLKEDNIKIDNKILDKFFNDLDHNQLTKKKKNKIIANYPGDAYQIDIIIYDRYEFNNYKYILCVIDVYSRYIEVRPMTNRTNENINKCMFEIFESMGLPYRIQCDNEFNTNQFLIN